MPIIWASLARNFVAKNFKKSPNLVTLTGHHPFEQNKFYNTALNSTGDIRHRFTWGHSKMSSVSFMDALKCMIVLVVIFGPPLEPATGSQTFECFHFRRQKLLPARLISFVFYQTCYWFHKILIQPKSIICSGSFKMLKEPNLLRTGFFVTSTVMQSTFMQSSVSLPKIDVIGSLKSKNRGP